MAQFVAPATDLDNTGVWTSTPLWSKVNTAEATVVVSDSSPTSSEPFTVDGSSVTDPAVSTGHVLRARWAKNATGGANYTGNLQLRQGYTSEASPGTLVATLTSGAISGTTLQTDTHTLTAGEANSITDYTDLQLRVWAAKSGGGAGRAFKVDLVELEVPDASADRRSDISWAELEVPDAPRRSDLSFAEFEVPTAPRASHMSWAEMETPNAPRVGQISWAELETPTAPRRSDLSFAELETPDAPRAGHVSWAELEIPVAARRADVSFTELEVRRPSREQG